MAVSFDKADFMFYNGETLVLTKHTEIDSFERALEEYTRYAQGLGLLLYYKKHSPYGGLLFTKVEY